MLLLIHGCHSVKALPHLQPSDPRHLLRPGKVFNITQTETGLMELQQDHPLDIDPDIQTEQPCSRV